MRKIFNGIRFSNCALSLGASLFLAFGLYNVHSLSGVTEGGVLGLTLFFDNWLGISPSVSGLVLNIACYALGGKVLGRKFLVYSAIAAAGFSGGYRIFESFDPLWPQLANHPLWASLIGALFVGIGAGLCVRAGGAPCGDDALAMSLSAGLKIKIQWVYLFTDLVVLLLSLTYIPFSKILYSLLTVVISGQIVGFIQGIKFPKKTKSEDVASRGTPM
ncbi:MAG: YitT family protein [Clostridia bacterium]|nr:YitT family protein [Clostridia bacterium]